MHAAALLRLLHTQRCMHATASCPLAATDKGSRSIELRRAAALTATARGASACSHSLDVCSASHSAPLHFMSCPSDGAWQQQTTRKQRNKRHQQQANGAPVASGSAAAAASVVRMVWGQQADTGVEGLGVFWSAAVGKLLAGRTETVEHYNRTGPQW